MKLFRKLWVFLTNGAAIYLLYQSFSQVASLNTLLEQGRRNRMLWLGFVLRASIPALGILFEVSGLRFAKWVNIGYFLLVGTGFSVIWILNRTDYHALPFLFLGPLAIVVAVVDWFLYRQPRQAPTKT